MVSLRQALAEVREAAGALDRLGPVPFPLPLSGLEAVVVGGFLGMERSDWVLPGLRERVGAVLRGCPVERLVDGHAGARPWRVAPVSASPAARLLHACGLAMAGSSPVLVFCGEGSASYGAFHEALNLAALRQLPVVFLASVWHPDRDAPYAAQVAGSLAAKALALGVRARSVDGGLVTEVLSAVADARAHGGPSLVEARLQRGEDPVARAWDELTETDPAGLARA